LLTDPVGPLVLNHCLQVVKEFDEGGRNGRIRSVCEFATSRTQAVWTSNYHQRVAAPDRFFSSELGFWSECAS
jgi:hypothetical protein